MFRASMMGLCLLLTVNSALAGTPQEERNKANAIAFYSTQNSKDWQAARRYLADDYIENHPKSPKGVPGIVLLERFYQALSAVHPQHQSIVHRAFAEGDLVALHILDIDEPGKKGTALIAFYRFNEDGKIAEHWHAFQPVVGVMNANGMF